MNKRERIGWFEDPYQLLKAGVDVCRSKRIPLRGHLAWRRAQVCSQPPTWAARFRAEKMGKDQVEGTAHSQPKPGEETDQGPPRWTGPKEGLNYPNSISYDFGII